MSARRDALVVLAMVAWVKKRLKTVEENAKAAADVAYPGEKSVGALGGKEISSTSRITRQAATPFTVLDQEGFVEWVKARWPSEIQEAVRPAFLSVLAERADGHDGILIDDDGEVCEAVKLSDPIVYTATYLRKGADEALGPLLDKASLASLPDFIQYDEKVDLDEHTD